MHKSDIAVKNAIVCENVLGYANCHIVFTYTVFRKKHLLTFCSISPWKIFRFSQKFQEIFTRKQVFHW